MWVQGLKTYTSTPLYICLWWLSQYYPFFKGHVSRIYTLWAHTWCNSSCCPPWGTSAKCVHQVSHLRQPVAFLSTREEWNFSLWSSSKVDVLHPEWGMITVLVRVVKASRMIVIFTVSHDDRFHSTPVKRAAHKHGCEEHRHGNPPWCHLPCAVT